MPPGGFVCVLSQWLLLSEQKGSKHPLATAETP